MQRFWNFSQHLDFYLKSNTLLGDAFEKFKIIFLEIYEFDPAKFLSAPVLVWQSALKKCYVKWELLTGIEMLLIV